MARYAAASLLLLALFVSATVALPVGPFSQCVFEVKRFFNEEINAGNYPNVTVKYIAGHVPEMVLYNIEGAEADRINVEGKTFSEMQALMANLGFHSKAEMMAAGGHRAGAHWELRDFMHIPNLFSHTGDPDFVSRKDDIRDASLMDDE